jgi:hypothetical protein
MTIPPQTFSLFEAFPRVSDALVSLLSWAQRQPAENATLSGFEHGAKERLREVGRCLVQSFFDDLFAGEVAREGELGRVRERLVETSYGETYLSRHAALLEPGQKAFFPLDRQLNLPPERYALSVREQVARGIAQQPVQAVVEALANDGITVPKRQAEQLSVRAAQDVDAFYALPQHHGPSNDTEASSLVLVGSHDATGVLVRPEALREATQKKAAATGPKPKGDPTATASPQRHSHRMAAVSAVWDQEPTVRTADDVLAEGDAKATVTRLPRPQNKQIAASLELGTAASVRRLMTQMAQRDPSGQRAKVMLVDGEDKQLAAIKREATKLGLTVRVVLDLLHVMHYVWAAAKGLYPKTPGNASAWVEGVMKRLLTKTPTEVLEYLEQEYEARKPTPRSRRALKKCLTYLRERREYIHYARYLAQGWPIASGVIEGTCRSLVKDRLGVTGARWGLPGAEAVLRLRAVERSGDWEAYWAFHEAQEARRHHAAKNAA